MRLTFSLHLRIHTTCRWKWWQLVFHILDLNHGLKLNLFHGFEPPNFVILLYDITQAYYLAIYTLTK